MRPLNALAVVLVAAHVLALLLAPSSQGFNRDYVPGFSHEVNALIAFKNGLQDPQGALASWHPSSVTPCIWLHVTCDANNKVHSLDLAQSGLAGSISGSLAALQSLRALSLQDNGLTGSIPPQLTILSNLQILHLSNNDLSGPIPTEFSQRFSIDSFKPGNPGLCGAVLHKSC